MIVNQLHQLHAQVNCPYESLCAAALVSHSTFKRWRGRIARGEPVLQKTGPKPLVPAELENLRQQLRGLEHGRQRSRGSGVVYVAHRQQISRRGFDELVRETRREVLRERHADLRRIQWLIPGTVWAVDPTEVVVWKEAGRQKVPVLPVLDLAARYQLPPLVGERLTGEVVAVRLEKLFQQFGAPLVLKRDNGSNLNSHEVDEVLRRWWVLPLNSPPYYPPYNGVMERAQRDFKTALRPRLATNRILTLPELALTTACERNHSPRRCLQGQTACEMFAGAKTNMRGYTGRRRKELFEQTVERAMHIMREQPVRNQGHADTAWRLAVETLLQQEGIITILDPKTVTRFP